MRIDSEHNEFFRILAQKGDAENPVILGPYSGNAWRRDPRHLFFTLARHKFCVKMLAGSRNMLAVGCGDAFALPLFFSSAGSILGIDILPDIIAYNQTHDVHHGKTEFLCHDISESPLERRFDAAFSLDVIEFSMNDEVVHTGFYPMAHYLMALAVDPKK